MRGEEYLVKRGQYTSVFSRGSPLISTLIVIKVLPNGLELSRYGLVTSKRVGGAVVRNRVKRRLREILRQTELKAGWDIVFIARQAAATASFADLKQSVGRLLSQAKLLVKNNEKACLNTN